MVSLLDRFKGAFSVFTNPAENGSSISAGDRDSFFAGTYGTVGARPDRSRYKISFDKSLIPSIYTRISVDVALQDIRHTRHDKDDRYVEDIFSGLHDCLQVEANLDQSALQLIQDVVLMCFDKGAAAVVPVETTMNPKITGAYDIKSLRVGEIKQWRPQDIQIELYNDRTGKKQLIWLPKHMVAIVENPFYMVMNEPNSTLQRLTRKLNLLDSVDEASSSGKLDLIIQLPYVVRTEQKREQANQRMKDIEYQLRTNKYGIAYTDGTEKITQLNRPTENGLLGQIEFLTKQLFDQLGLTAEIMNGTATEATMLNYNRRTVEPILTAIVQEFRRKFLTKTARTQGQSIDFFSNPFALIPMSQLAEIADKLSRNEVVTANELRGFIGLKPSKEPKADQLVNSNMPVEDTGVQVPGSSEPPPAQEDPLNEPYLPPEVVAHSEDPVVTKAPRVRTLTELQRRGPLTNR